MPFRRRILRYGPSPDDLHSALEDRAVAGCQFELLRRGGCGRGEVRLRDGFDDRQALPVGQWIACEYDDGDRWYLGRIEERRARSPGGVSLRLEGMSIQLNEVYPGGFGLQRDGRRPHRYAATDLFPADPDREEETADLVDRPEDAVRLLLSQYVVPATDIKVEAGLIENAESSPELVSLKFHGEETVRSILKDLSLRALNASWGVDEWGRFYFLRPRANPLTTFREGVDLIELTETTTREVLFNRLLLTGGYVYGGDLTGIEGTTAYRWRGNYRQPASVAAHGERRIRLWVPWIRSQADSRQFVREFFRTHAEPARRYAIQVVDQAACPRPWWGRVRVRDRHGNLLISAQPEAIRVQFDNTPRLQLELGPDDPRTHWPEPPHDERFPVVRPQLRSGDSGDDLSLTSDVGPTDEGTSLVIDPESTSLVDSSLELSSNLDSSDLYSSELISSGWSSTGTSSGNESSDLSSLLVTSDITSLDSSDADSDSVVSSGDSSDAPVTSWGLTDSVDTGSEVTSEAVSSGDGSEWSSDVLPTSTWDSMWVSSDDGSDGLDSVTSLTVPESSGSGGVWPPGSEPPSDELSSDGSGWPSDVQSDAESQPESFVNSDHPGVSDYSSYSWT